MQPVLFLLDIFASPSTIICFFTLSLIVFVCFLKAFPKGEYADLAYSITLLWSGGSISSP